MVLRTEETRFKHVGRFHDMFRSVLLFQQFTYGVVREGVIAENIPQLFAKIPQTFRTLPDAITRIYFL